MIAPKDPSFRSTALETNELYTVKVTDLKTHLEVRKYSTEMLRRRHDLDDEPKEGTRTDVAKRGSSMVFHRANAIRSFQTLRNLALANKDHWKSFITLTFAENITDLDQANNKFHIYTTQIRKRYPAFRYIGVPEFQKRGAIHYHLMTNLVSGLEYVLYDDLLEVKSKYVLLPVRELRRLWKPQLKKFIDLRMYDLPFWDKDTNGFSSAFTLDNVDANFSITGYLAKYFWKNVEMAEGSEEGKGTLDIRLFSRIKILHSRNLDKPTVIYLDDYDQEHENWLKTQTEGLDVVADKTVESTSEYVPDVRITEYKKGNLE